MTDKARELLERALNFFEEICDSRSVGIEKSINAYLAELEVKPFVRLSKEEIMAIVRADPDFDEMMWDKTAVRFARAIEDALEEKNK